MSQKDGLTTDTLALKCHLGMSRQRTTLMLLRCEYSVWLLAMLCSMC